MNRNYQLDTTRPISGQDLITQIAFHEAGHAAAIYLYNKHKQLPPVYFQITINALARPVNHSLNCDRADLRHVVGAVEGGSLINSLPVALIESTDYYSNSQDAYQDAFEADMINLLIGPLAEAKHVAIRDNEHFNAQLVNIQALHNYGGSSKLAKIDEYLNAFIADENEHSKKLSELYTLAFEFISAPVYWYAIEQLADYILNRKNTTISCEEAMTVLDDSVSNVTAAHWLSQPLVNLNRYSVSLTPVLNF